MARIRPGTCRSCSSIAGRQLSPVGQTVVELVAQAAPEAPWSETDSDSTK